MFNGLDARTVWAIDAVPLPVRIANEPVGRDCALLVTADDMVLAAEIEREPPSEPEAVAEFFVTALTAVVAAVGRTAPKPGAWPAKVWVRHAIVAAALAPLLAPYGTEVGISARLPFLDNAARSLRASMLGDPWTDLDGPILPPDAPPELARAIGNGGITLMSLPETWAAWGLPDAVIAVLLDAARAFHAAAPWRRLSNEQALWVTDSIDADRQWTLSVLGAGKQVFGIALYGSDDDFLRMFTLDDPHAMLRGLDDAVLSLSFDRRAEVAPALRQEFKRKRWPVVPLDLYPKLTVTNTPAGGLSLAQAGLITRVLGATVRFTARHTGDLDEYDASNPLRYDDAESGLALRYEGDRTRELDGHFAVPCTLTPGNATGPLADALAVNPHDVDVDTWLETARAPLAAFHAWLHASAPHGQRAEKKREARHTRDADLFFDFLTGYQRASLSAVHEVDLRIFLYDWFPSKVLGAQRSLPAMLAALQQLFEWMAIDGIVCPWAGPLLADRASVEARITSKPNGLSVQLAGSAWRDQLYHDLVGRVMYPDAMAVDGDELPEYTGPLEAALFGELQRLVLHWREDAIAGGVTESSAVAHAVCARQRKWEKAKHAGFGRSPSAIIRAERRGTA